MNERSRTIAKNTTMKATDTGADMGDSPMDEQFRHFFENQGIPFPQEQASGGPVPPLAAPGFLLASELPPSR